MEYRGGRMTGSESERGEDDDECSRQWSLGRREGSHGRDGGRITGGGRAKSCVGLICRFSELLFLDYLFSIHDLEGTTILQVVHLIKLYHFASLTFGTRPYPEELFIEH